MWNRIKDPFEAIEAQGGFGKLLADEVYGVRATPNYTLHLLGGGTIFVGSPNGTKPTALPHPYLLAFLTSYLANIGNEAVETTASQSRRMTILPIFFFLDIVGKLLFLNDSVVRFMHDTMQMRPGILSTHVESQVPSIDNAGSNYIFRPHLFGDRFVPSFTWG